MASRSTLLFVDDEEDIREILEKTFERRFHVLTAKNGPEALQVLKLEHVDVLITDQRMPGMTGIELAAAARSQGLELPIILLTAFTEPGELIAAINKGQVYRYLTKPWDVTDLIITVKNAVEVSLLRQDKDRLLRQLRQRVEALSVLFEVTHRSAGDAPTHDALIDRVLTAVGRVLPYDCGAALVSVDGGRQATLRLRCAEAVAAPNLVQLKELTLAAYHQQSGIELTEACVFTQVTGTAPTEGAPATFESQLAVPLLDDGRAVGTIVLLSERVGAYGSGDEELLDALANQMVGAIRALRASEAQHRRRLQQTVESMADGVLLTDEQGHIVVLNPAAQRLLHLGAHPEAWGRDLVQDLLGLKVLGPLWGRERNRPGVHREELKLYDRDVALASTSVVDPQGGLQGVCIVLRDVTEQKRLEQRKEEFVSIISHELRTPLTAIAGALDLVLNVLEGTVSERQRRYLTLAKDSTEELNSVVDDLLDLSRFSEGKLQMRPEQVSATALVELALERYAPVFAQRGIALSKELPLGPVPLKADPHRLEQVLNNLLTNAAKFTPEGGSARLQLAPSQCIPGFLALSLENSGEPIPEANLERIFDKFEQARSFRTRTVRGTGLGLAICRHIVEAHGGHIWAEPSVSGASFAVVLPLEPPSVQQHETPGKAGGPREQVLLFHPQWQERLVLKALLRGAGYNVLLCADVGAALAQARIRLPGLLLLGVRIPDDAVQAQTEARALASLTRDLPTLTLGSWRGAGLATPLAPVTFLRAMESLHERPASAAPGWETPGPRS